MTIEKYKELIRQCELTEVEDYLLSAARPIINLLLGDKENYSHTGNSRVAGDPDLPSGFSWPMTEEGVPMSFIAQFNLDELHQLDIQQLLPATGMLYYFMGDIDQASNIAHKVVYIADKTALQRTPPPGTTVLEEGGRFKGYQLQAAASIMPPNYTYVDYNLLSNDEMDGLEDLCNHLTDGIGRIGGYADGQHADHAIETAMYMVAGREYDYSPANARKTLLQHFKGDEQAVEDTLNDIHLLFQVDSDNEVGFCWWDAGCIQFFMSRKDMKAAQFDRTYLTLYSS